MDNTVLRTWAEVRPDNLVHNMNVIRGSLPAGTKFLGVVKADAYGHGAVEAARALERGGADYLAVACLSEALELRRAGISLPVLILGPTPAEAVPALLAQGITQALGSPEAAAAYAAAVRAAGASAPLRVHLKLDTGMSRTGFAWQDAEAAAAACRLPELDVEGVFTHFAASDMPEDPEAVAYTHTQLRRFQEALAALDARHIRFRLRHCANSGAVLYYPQETAMDLVRPGIALYGYGDAAHRLDLRPCMSLKTRVAAVQTYPAGTRIGYGGTYVTERASRIGVLPVGYADGLHRALSNRCAFHTAGGPAPLRGRVCMDLCMVDLTRLPEVGVGSEVEIFGTHNPLEPLAEAAGTISYELLCAVSPRVPRFYLTGGASAVQEP